MPLTKVERDAALDVLEKQFTQYVEDEQKRLLTEYNFLQAAKKAISIENSAARRSKELDKAKALVSVKQLLPSVTT